MGQPLLSTSLESLGKPGLLFSLESLRRQEAKLRFWTAEKGRTRPTHSEIRQSEETRLQMVLGRFPVESPILPQFLIYRETEARNMKGLAQCDELLLAELRPEHMFLTDYVLYHRSLGYFVLLQPKCLSQNSG